MTTGYTVSSFRAACALLATFLTVLADNLAAASPRIACKEPEFKFGDRPNTGVVEHVFVIENQGDAPLRIGNIRACCGAAAGIESSAIAPGSNSNLKATVNLSGRRGEMKKSFYIASNDPNQPYYQIRMIGNPTAEVYVDPGNLDFGQVRPTGNPPGIVRLVCATNITLAVTNIVVDNPAFTASFDKTTEGYAITVHIVSPLKQGVTQGNMRIFTNHGAYHDFNVHLVATLADDIQVVPQEIVLVSATGKVEPVTRHLAIRSRSDNPFKVLKVETPDPTVEVTLDTLAPAGYRLEVKNLRSFAALDGKRIIIRTDHPEGRELVVPIRVIREPEGGK